MSLNANAHFCYRCNDRLLASVGWRVLANGIVRRVCADCWSWYGSQRLAAAPSATPGGTT
jgi:hypothetical protein